MLEFNSAVIRNGSFQLTANLSLTAGTLAAVVGPSGSGKSTLIEAVSGFLPVTSGEIRWNGARLDTVNVGDRPATMVFQDNNLFPHVTAGGNIRLARDGITDEEIERGLTDVGLPGLAGRRPAELSGGQQARVVLARTLLMERPILLMDEPFSALGPGQRKTMLGLVTSLARDRGMTLMMVTHEPDDLALLDQVILVDGKAARPPQNVLAFLKDPPQLWREYIGLPSA